MVLNLLFFQMEQKEEFLKMENPSKAILYELIDRVELDEFKNIYIYFKLILVNVWKFVVLVRDYINGFLYSFKFRFVGINIFLVN